MDRITTLTCIAQRCLEMDTLDSAVDGVLTPATVSVEGVRAALEIAYAEGVRLGVQAQELHEGMARLGLVCRWHGDENDVVPTLKVYGDMNQVIYCGRLPLRMAPEVMEMEVMKALVGNKR